MLRSQIMLRTGFLLCITNGKSDLRTFPHPDEPLTWKKRKPKGLVALRKQLLQHVRTADIVVKGDSSGKTGSAAHMVLALEA